LTTRIARAGDKTTGYRRGLIMKSHLEEILFYRLEALEQNWPKNDTGLKLPLSSRAIRRLAAGISSPSEEILS